MAYKVYDNDAWRQGGVHYRVYVQKDGTVKKIMAESKHGCGYVYLNTWRGHGATLRRITEELEQMWVAELRAEGVQI